MSFENALCWLGGHNTVDRPADDGYLLEKNSFQAAIRRERLRSDRSLSPFALLTLAFGTPVNSGTTRDVVLRTLEHRLRATDTAGWLSATEVGIILVDTSAAGACKLGDDLRSSLGDVQLFPRLEVYVYPSFESPEQRPTGDGEPLKKLRGEPSLALRPMEALLAQRLSTGKRLIDLMLATTGLIMAFPLMLLAGLAIKSTSRGPILYLQQRDGWRGRKFWIYKFRTMVIDADAIKAELRDMSEQDGPAFKLKNDPRVTPIGRLLRRTCVDELPQLFNVLKGDMSLVGPRPMCSKEARHCDQWQRRRLDVTPGLTCIWQVHGGAKVTFSEWMRMDLNYIRSRSLWNDLRLMVSTVPSVIRRDGIY